MSGSAASVSGTAGGSGAGASGSGAGPSTAPAGGLCGSLEDKDCELLCPVCFELIDEAYVTRCGHSFCHACIAKAVELHRRCPKCGAALPTRDHIFPNFLLNELVARRRVRAGGGAGGAGGAGGTGGVGAGGAGELRALLAAEARRLPLAELDCMLDLLARRKRLLEAESEAAQHRLVYEFLSHLHTQRTQQLQQVQREAALVRADMDRVLHHLNAEAGLARVPVAGEPDAAPAPPPLAEPLALAALHPHPLGALGTLATPSGSGVVGGAGGGAGAGGDSEGARSEGEEETFAGGGGGGGGGGGAGDLAARWRRLEAHFDDFVQCYFAHRSAELYFPPSGSGAATPAPSTHSQQGGPLASTSASEDQRLPECGAGGAAGGGTAEGGTGRGGPAGDGGPPAAPDALDAFRADVAAWTRYRALRPIATLAYCSDAINYSTIVSTIEFDKDDEFFAIAGVTKRIKVFEWGAVVRDAVDVHYPCAEMAGSHKISCVSFNHYHKNVLASSDYEGTVSVWDACVARRTRALQEHDKRCWSVHFSRADPRLLASGSDDARVKLWALGAERSVATIEAKFNVCCVRFNPRSSCHLAFGSADHCVHYYDLRAPRAPLRVFRDHRKAVSYVQFLDHRTLVSASTDSQLKLWSVDSPRAVRSFTGHSNEKNFVGLATDGKYIACGSENNALYVYYNGLARPLLAYRFDALRGFLERERREEEASEFVSAVCWRRDPQRPALLAANSQGTIKVLELV